MESKKEGKDQESIQSSTTPDPEYWTEQNRTLLKIMHLRPLTGGVRD